MDASMKGGGDYPGRQLVPTPIPPMEQKIERFSAIREIEGIDFPKNFLNQKQAIQIPSNTKVHLILDQSYLTTGYLTLVFSKGKDAEIRIGYTEAYYSDVNKGEKGNRNEVKGKTFNGYEDKIIGDGGTGRNFTSLWWRTWRYIDIKIETKGEPLVIDDIYGVYSAYPFEKDSKFNAPGHDYLEKIIETGWRTARLCANETYMDCPYYEQLQYFGDTRIQTMVSLYNTHDTCMVRNAIEQGRQSMVADGLTMSRYPTDIHQFIPSFSLWWIGIGYDYWMYRGEEDYLKTLLPAYRNVMAWYEQWLKPNKSLDYIPYWFFTDWTEGMPSGEPIRDKDGNSALQDLIYILTLESLSKMEEAFGMPVMAEHYQSIATAMKATIYPKYWDKTRRLFADTFDHRSYSQHVNALAILAGIVEGDDAKIVMRNTLTQKDILQCTIYFRYYLNQALNRVGLGNELLDNLQIWKDQLDLGLSTWAERPEPSRSDCHAWGASLNVEFYRILLGIDTDAPGFKKVKISPSLNNLKSVSGSMPHPQGNIAVDYKINEKGKLTAIIDLPVSLGGTFVWKGKEYTLKGGSQTLAIE
jgi:hypothetical protein